MLHHEMQETWNRRNRAVSARFRLALACFASLLALAATPSFAADLPPRPAVAVAPLPKPSLMTELRLGIFAHDPSSPESGSADINGEILFPKWFGADSSWAVLYPRLHVGGTANTAGKTSTAYAGLTWSTDFLSSFFIEGTLGGAVHNGYTGDGSRAGENSLGCSPLFRKVGIARLPVHAPDQRDGDGGALLQCRALLAESRPDKRRCSAGLQLLERKATLLH